MKILFLSLPLLFLLVSCTNSPQSPSNNTLLTSQAESGDIVVSSSIKETRTVSTPTYGSGKHTLEIFADFQCPACQNFSKGLGMILEEYASSGKLTIIYRQFPLTSMHKNAYRDAIAALCGAEQGKYMETKKALYALETEKREAKVSDNDRVNALVGAGLDSDAVSKCLASDAYKAQVDSDIARGESLRVTGTPTLFLDEKRLDLSGFKDKEMFISFLDQILTK